MEVLGYIIIGLIVVLFALSIAVVFAMLVFVPDGPYEDIDPDDPPPGRL